MGKRKEKESFKDGEDGKMAEADVLFESDGVERRVRRPGSQRRMQKEIREFKLVVESSESKPGLESFFGWNKGFGSHVVP